MNRFRALLVLGLVGMFLAAASLPAAATEDSSEGDDMSETTETTVAPDPGFENGEPAVVIPPPQEVEEDDQPWTSRFMYPLLVVLMIVLIIGMIIGWNRLRNRYDVVQDA